MEFKTHEDRRAAVKKATEELGSAYGELKYKEFMLKEMMQSFVPGENEKAGAPISAKAEPVKTEAPKPAKKKAAPKPKKKAAEAEVVEKEEAPVTESTAEVVEATVDATPSDEGSDDCPVSTAAELRNLMLEKFTESGRSADVQMALKQAVLDATGCEKVMDVKPEQVADAYAAIVAVEV